MKRAGFTLLEVMVAVAILSVGLTAIFTSEAGAIKVSTRARRTNVAVLLARCKLGEIEEKVLKDAALPAVSADEEDDCCDGLEQEGFRCAWKMERIVLPDTTQDSGDNPLSKKMGSKAGGAGGGPGGAGGGLDPLGLAGGGAGAPPIGGATPSIPGMPGAPGAGGNPTDQVSSFLETGGSGSGGGGLADMAMQLVYPVIKPSIEEQVRRVTVTVKWREGSGEKDISVVQYFVGDASTIPGLQDALNANQAANGTPGTPGTPGANGPGTNPIVTPGK